MKIFKKRFFAFILAFLIIVTSSLLSVNIKLNKEFSAVSEDFYSGVLIDGKRDISIHSQLIIIGRAAEEIAAVAERNGLDVAEFMDNVDYFNHDILVMDGDFSYLHYLYGELLDDIMDVGTSINSTTLDSKDEQIVVKALEDIISAKENIENSAYNERVRKYISALHFPMDVLADITGAYLPEYFA